HPPADVVACALVFAPRIAQADDQLHAPRSRSGAGDGHAGQDHFSSSAPSSSSPFGLRMSSGSVAASPSAPASGAAGSSSTCGGDTTHTVASASSSTSTPSGT